MVDDTSTEDALAIRSSAGNTLAAHVGASFARVLEEDGRNVEVNVSEVVRPQDRHSRSSMVGGECDAHVEAVTMVQKGHSRQVIPTDVLDA